MLYIVGTPLGNLDDISLRQAKTIAYADLLLAEDTRSAQILIAGIKERFKITFKTNQKIISYYKEKEFEKLPFILESLDGDKEIVLITESGMPVISDPGYLLINTLIKRNILFTVIPGPTAVSTALVYSGFNPNSDKGGYMFCGFLPKKDVQIIQIINKLELIKKIYPDMIFAFYESPNRIHSTLTLLNEYLPNNYIAICRELTKKFEEISRGSAHELSKREYKGEITLLIQ
ncbi:MAG: ribosomal RNA small subunit methyltransferase I [bacterium]|nr:ribosomal RNA small subunit methyltransferase I [bacterium]